MSTDTKTSKAIADYYSKNPDALYYYLESQGRTPRKDGMFPCPNEGAHTHGDANPAAKWYPAKDGKGDSWYCHKCKEGGDLLDMVQILEGFPDKESARSAYFKRVGYKHPDLWIDGKPSMEMDLKPQVKTQKTQAPKQAAGNEITHPEKLPSKAYYKECLDNLSMPEAVKYLTSRGISVETARKLKIGYDPAWVMPTASHNFRTPRLIGQATDTFYATRQITPTERGGKLNSPGKMQFKDGEPFVVETGTLNSDEITKYQDVWVVEGMADCASFVELGHQAVALLGKGNHDTLLEEAKKKKAKCRFLIALDYEPKNPDTEKDRIKMLKTFKEEGFRVYAPPVDILFAGKKDANEALQADRAGFEERIKQAVRWADEAQKEELAGYYAKSADATLEAYLKDAEIPKPVYPTNIPALDELLNGGFRAGLILLAAGTGFGKSYAAQQFAGEFAKQGHDVLFFCLEMGSDEMTPRDLSRLTCKNSLEKHGNNSGASTALQIEEFYKFPDWGYERQSSFEAAKREYCSTEGKIFYFGLDTHDDLNVTAIQNITRRHVWLTGKRPVVFVDYLQLLPALDPKQTTKDAVDQNMRELIKLWHEFNIPLFAICSLNRTNYDEPFSNAALKESGGTEYGANYVIGMQFPGVEYDDFFQVEPSGDDISEENQQKRKSRLSTNHNQRNERQQDSDYATDIQLKITKARKGRRGIVNLKFYSWFGYYVGSLRNDHSNSHVPLVGEPVIKNRVEEIC